MASRSWLCILLLLPAAAASFINMHFDSPNQYHVLPLGSYQTACLQVSTRPNPDVTVLPTQSAGQDYLSVTINKVYQLNNNNMYPTTSMLTGTPYNNNAASLQGINALSYISTNTFPLGTSTGGWATGNTWCQITLPSGSCTGTFLGLPGQTVPSPTDPAAVVMTIVYWSSRYSNYAQNTTEPLDAQFSVTTCAPPPPPPSPPPPSPLAVGGNTAAKSSTPKIAVAKSTALIILAAAALTA